MLGLKWIDSQKVRLAEPAWRQYEIAEKELDKLCEASSMNWGFIREDGFVTAMRISIGEGMLIGAGITGLICGGVYILKRIKHKKT